MKITKCVFCNTSENLNTQMSVVVDNERIETQICDEHADDASPKKIKEIVKSRTDKSPGEPACTKMK